MRLACVLIHRVLVPGVPCNGKQPQQVFAKILTLLEQFSPTVEVEGLGCAYLDVTGVDNEPELVQEVAEAVFQQTQLRPSVGIADNKFVARAAAFIAKPEAPVIVRPGGERQFVVPLSVDLVPCSEETRVRLHFLGLHAIGQLARIPRESLKAQFGDEGRLLYEISRGIDRRPLCPRQKAEVVTELIRFDIPVSALAEIIPAIERAVERVTVNLKKEWRLCRTVSLRLTLSSGSTREQVFHLKQASNSHRTILLRLKSWLVQVDLTDEVDGAEISFDITGDKGSQPDLWESKKRAADIQGMAQTLEQRFGHQPLKKAVPLDPDALLPENRFRLIDVR